MALSERKNRNKELIRIARRVHVDEGYTLLTWPRFQFHASTETDRHKKKERMHSIALHIAYKKNRKNRKNRTERKNRKNRKKEQKERIERQNRKKECIAFHIEYLAFRKKEQNRIERKNRKTE